jgi:hypothetical protein
MSSGVWYFLKKSYVLLESSVFRCFIVISNLEGIDSSTKVRKHTHFWNQLLRPYWFYTFDFHSIQFFDCRNISISFLIVEYESSTRRSWLGMIALKLKLNLLVEGWMDFVSKRIFKISLLITLRCSIISQNRAKLSQFDQHTL